MDDIASSGPEILGSPQSMLEYLIKPRTIDTSYTRELTSRIFTEKPRNF